MQKGLLAGVFLGVLVAASAHGAPPGAGGSNLAEEALQSPALAGVDMDDGSASGSSSEKGGKEAPPVQNPFTVKSGLYAGIFGGGAFSNPEYGYSAYPAPIGLSPFTERGGIVNGVGGLLLGYEFAGNKIGDSWDFYWRPAVQLDAFYLGLTNASSSYGVGVPGLPGTITNNENFNAGVITVDGLLNLYTPLLMVHFGVGVGGAYISNSSASAVPAGGPFAGQNLLGAGITSDSGAFAAQGIAGIDRWIGKRWSIFVEYRFLLLTGTNFSFNGNPAVFGPNQTVSQHFDQFTANLVLAGLRYKF
ncbi:hypothetical protein MAMC_01565 [Methylacidimicrobium cyclopophantes]|uniref:Outer membrane protein beta-barrel domain-containing protein n=1 Tax=Methylacidimicrobium cyclopophantes TaxID=1041766 RepID=A0A5E6MG71_9BACT|nr:hypothetical protein [Methylacidimicrobium cyclopophantes]VVM07350.1 hypothetical protein MAMC_01565 [Methylacidimicrobium cyclopophantes]